MKCQSCGMPLNRDPQGGGSNSDGSKSKTYCSLCFENGKFIHPNFNASQMQDYCVEQLAERGMPRIVGWLFTRGIPKLSRWKG